MVLYRLYFGDADSDDWEYPELETGWASGSSWAGESMYGGGD